MSRRLKQQAIGDHVRRLREAARLTVRGLAARTDFSPSFISQLENGQVSPSIASMERIAEVLGVSLGEFFAAAGDEEVVSGLVVRAHQRHSLSSGWSKAEIESLGRPRGQESLEPTLVTLQPGGRSGKHPYPHPREEFAFVVEGQVVLRLGPDEYQLHPGDAVTILPKETRLWENRGADVARVLIISARSSR